MDDLSFLEGMYAAGAADYFDIYSANAFGMDLPPEDPPDPETLNFQRVLLHREIMERYGDGDKAVWFNEYGWNAAPESFPADRLIWKRVTEKQQAEYTLQGIKMAREEWPWSGVFMIWYFRQVGNISPERSDYYFRMVDPDFTPRPLYFAVQDVAGGQDAVLPGVYEETNPNVKTHGRWRNVIDKWAFGQAYIRSEVAGDSVTFTFTGPGIDLITRKGPGAGRFLVALDGRSVPGLSTNPQGVSYVDLYDPTLRDRARVPLVRNAGAGEHTLRLTVDGDRHEEATGNACALDAFVIVVEEDKAFPVIPLAAILVGLALNTWILWRNWRRLRWVIRAP